MNFYLYLKHFPTDGGPLRVGTSKAVHGLASGLAACGAQVSVLCEGPERVSYRAPEGFHVECFRNTGAYRSFRVAGQLSQYLQAKMHSASVMILNGIFHPAVFGVSRAAQRLGIPYVMAPHGSYDRPLFRRNAHLKWPYWFACERPALTGALAIQVLDSRQDQWTLRRGIQTPSVEVPNGFSTADVYPAEFFSWRQQGRVRLLYWGRMHIQQKGLDALLDAVAELAKYQKLELTLQGPDWHGEKQVLMRRAAQLGLDGCARFVNPDFETPPPRIMNDYDIVCMPSRYEGFGLAALEAMLAGRPLLVSEPAGIARHVRASGCGVVVKPDKEGIQQGLSDLMERRQEWREMGMRGRAYAFSELNWNSIARRACSRYEALANGNETR